jgi:hypothetical protein
MNVLLCHCGRNVRGFLSFLYDPLGKKRDSNAYNLIK